MRILIADDSVASSKALRPLFHTSRGKSAKKRLGKMAATAGQLTISCAPSKRAMGKRSQEDCSCHGLDLGDQPEVTATLLDAMGIALLNRGCREEGAQLIEKARKIRLQFFGKDHPATAASHNSYSRVLRERGDYDDAVEVATEALRINRAVFGNRGLPVAVSLVELGVVQLLQGLFEAAESTASEGIAILQALNLFDCDPNTTRLLDIRGRAEAAQGRLDDAADTYKELLPLDRRQLGTAHHPKYATHLANSGLVQEALKKFGGAEKAYRQAIELYKDGLNRPCHPNLIDAYANLGSLLRAHGKSDDRREAGDLLEKALRLGQRIRGDSHTLVGNDHANLARWQYDAGRTREATENFARALRIYDRSVKLRRLPQSHCYIAEALTWKGRLLVETGRAAAAANAEKPLTDAIGIWPVQLGPNTLGEAAAKACLGRSFYLQNKNPGQARRLLESAYPVIEAGIGRNHVFAKRVDQWIDDLGPALPGQAPPQTSAYA